ncbi:hypothetical protein L7F22_051179 [Adiantum nelumboides]|nr:hypothetical protein [Adiantum nelumboides]
MQSSNAAPQAEAILEWLQQEMGYRPQSPYQNSEKLLPSIESLRKICRGNMLPVWKFLLERVKSEKTVETVKRNILVHGSPTSSPQQKATNVASASSDLPGGKGKGNLGKEKDVLKPAGRRRQTDVKSRISRPAVDPAKAKDGIEGEKDKASEGTDSKEKALREKETAEFEVERLRHVLERLQKDLKSRMLELSREEGERRRLLDDKYDSSVDALYVHKVTVVGAHASKDNSSDTCVDAYMRKVDANEVCEATLETIHVPMVQNGKDIVDECKSLSTSTGSEDDESEIDKDEAIYDGDTSDACESWCSDVCDDDIESLDPLKDMVALHKEKYMFWEGALQQHSMDACNEDEMVGYGHGVSTSSKDDVGEDDAMMVDLTLGPCALPELGVGQPSSGFDTKVLGHENDRDKIYVRKDLMLMPSQRDVFNDTCPMVA